MPNSFFENPGGHSPSGTDLPQLQEVQGRASLEISPGVFRTEVISGGVSSDHDTPILPAQFEDLLYPVAGLQSALR